MKVTSKENKEFKPFKIEITFESEKEVSTFLKLLSAHTLEWKNETKHDPNCCVFPYLLPLKKEILKQLK